MTTMCPSCGYNFTTDAPIQRDGYTLSPSICLLPDGNDARLTLGEAGVLYGIAKAGGEWVSTEALLNRVSDSECGDLVPVLVYRIRKKIGPACPITSRRTKGHGGYRWCAP